MIWPEGKVGEALELDVILHPNPGDDVPHIEVQTKSGKVFGPQPFLAIETRSRRFIHDNFDFTPEGDRWYYAFHADTLPLEDVRRLGIAANDKYGNRVVKVLALSERIPLAEEPKKHPSEPGQIVLIGGEYEAVWTAD